MLPPFAHWLRDFAVTQIVEVPIYRRAFKCGFWEAFGASAITHPVVWWANERHLVHAPWATRATASELFAWLVEAGYFALVFRRKHALAWTFAANAASFSIGLLAWWLTR
jgi:hypothetical protein